MGLVLCLNVFFIDCFFLGAWLGVVVAGTSTTKLMSPDRVKQAIDKLGTAALTQVFTASDTWIKPTGLSANARVIVELWGGGGGGGRNTSSSDSGGGGGGGGGYLLAHFLAADLPATVDVTVGAGGAGATSSVGSDGGYSQFDAMVGVTNVIVMGGTGGGNNVGGLGGSPATYLFGPTAEGGTGETGGVGNIGTSGGSAGSRIQAGAGGGAAGNGGTLRAPGYSVFGGTGGAGGASAGGTTAQPGGVRGGGGGGGRSTVGAAGGRGEVRVTVIK